MRVDPSTGELLNEVATELEAEDSFSIDATPSTAPAHNISAITAEAATAETQESEDEPENMYEDIYTFFSSELHPFYIRESPFVQDKSTDDTKRSLAWCPQWWLHVEAVSRISALWHGWEKSRLESGAALSTWILDHADRHMDRLLNPQGPFRYCSPKDGHTSKAVPFIVAEYPDFLTTTDAPLYNAEGKLRSPSSHLGA